MKCHFCKRREINLGSAADHWMLVDVYTVNKEGKLVTGERWVCPSCANTIVTVAAQSTALME